ncbi:MAG: phosphoglucosamine mutase [Deltaproteobacteria bacterium]|nr:MAG: phosphoglucosamine mutase [Deltaproteobacteria bacterium]
MRQLFGTDGIRGVANVYPMTTEIAMQVGRAIACIVKEKRGRKRIVIGKDTRLSGYMLENALAAGISSMGVDVMQVGPLPTPGIAFITTSMRADAGVVISASHNPFQDNGIKLFSGDGFKLADEVELQIEQLVLSEQMAALSPVAEEVGKAKRIDDARGRYIVFLKHTFPKALTLEGLHVVVDCAHGATYKVAPCVFEELGARVTSIGVAPDGKNINLDCGALYPEKMCQAVKDAGADVGLALDGDGDRLIVCDEKGRVVDGDQIMAICARELLDSGRLKKNTLVATVMSNMGLERAMRAMGGNLVRTDVGDRYVVEEMRKNGFSFGGEQSGHLVFLDHITTGDGILAALQLLAIMKKREKSLSALARVMTTFPQVLKNVATKTRVVPTSIKGFAEACQGFERELGSAGRILVRPSGTEPLLRIMVEGEDAGQISRIADALAALVEDTERR